MSDHKNNSDLKFTQRVISNLPTLLLFFGIALILYWPTRHAGFVTDYTGLAEQLRTYSFLDIFRNNWNFHSVIPAGYVLYWTVFKLFGIKSIGWYVVASLLHGLNASLLYSCVKKIGDLSGRDLYIAAVGSALLFLICPYQAEVLVWRVCLHYLLCGFLMFLTLRYVLEYLARPDNRIIIIVFFLQLMALLSKEYAYMLPVIATLWIKVYYRFSVREIISKAGKLMAALWLTIPVYLLMNKVYLGKWIGYNGADDAMGGSLMQLIPNCWKYLSKYLLQTRFFFDANDQLHIQQFFDKNALGISILTVAFFGLVWWSIWKKKNKIRVPGAIWLASFWLALAPSIFLYMPYLLLGENDRHGYVASWFLFPVLLLLIRKWPAIIKYGIIMAVAIVFLFLTHKINAKWQENSIVHKSLLDDFRWYDRDHVFVLSSPNNYEGLYLMRSCGTESALDDEIKYVLDRPFNGEVINVCQYNMVNLDHGGDLTRIDSHTYKFTYNQWGGWNWVCAQGAVNYENEYYSFKNEEKGFSVKMKLIPENSVFIYQDSLTWKEAQIEL